jgi:hypothetical protein
MPKVRVELVPVDYIKPRFDVEGPNESSPTNDDGSFTIWNVPPGKYHMAVNYNILPGRDSPYATSFYPGTKDRLKAQIIVVSEDGNVEGLRYVIPPDKLQEMKVTGRVAYADGRPVVDADIYLKEDENQTCCVEGTRTDAKGNFEMMGFATRKYRLWTFVEHKPFTVKVDFIGVSPVFVLDKMTGPFTIVMKVTRKFGGDALDEIEMRERGLLK